MRCLLLFSFYLKLLIVLSAIGCLIHFSATAQERELSKSKFTKIANLEGLKVRCILKDTFGFMWFGTEVGLYRYDGYNTLHLSTSTEGMELSSNFISALYEDSEANLWVGTDNGINKISADRRSITSYLATDDASAPGKNNFRAITETQNGALWCSTENGKLYRALDKEHFTFVSHVTSTTKGVLMPLVTHLTEDADHNLWIADAHWGYQKLSPEGKVLQRYRSILTEDWVVNYAHKNTLLFADNTHVYTYFKEENKFLPISYEELKGFLKILYQDKSGFIWIVTSDRLLRLDPKTKQTEDYTDAFMANGPERFFIDCIYEDKSGQLWFGTLYGVFRLEKSQDIFHTVSLPKEVGANTIFNIQAIFESGEGKILIGSYSGFFEYDPFLNQLQEYKLLRKGVSPKGDPWSFWTNPLVKAFVPDTHGNLWMATDGNGLLYYDTKSHTFSRIPVRDNSKTQMQAYLFSHSLLKDVDGQLWLGGDDNLYSIDPETYAAKPYTWGQAASSFSSLQIMALHQAKDKSIWVGTAKGLYKILKDKGVTARFASLPKYNKYNHQPGLTNDFIHCIYEDKSGRLWVGTKGGGINVLNPQSGRIEEVYTVKEGLAHDVVCAILPGKEELWISTDNGLSRLDLKEKTFRNFYTRDGLPTNTFNPGSAMAASDGTLYFGSMDGMVSFTPAQLLPQAAPPQVMLTRLVQHRGATNTIEETALAIHSIKDIRLEYQDKFFTVYFGLKDYLDYKNVHQFAYRLEGFTNQWQNIGSLNYIQFAGLPAGEYSLLIKGMGENGIWGKELRIPVWVGQAFYATTGAYVLYVVVALTIIGVIFWFQLTRMRLQNQLHLEHMQQEKLQELDQLKTEFFTNITHEFRTPLTLIISPLEQLCAPTPLPQPETLRQQLNIIHRNAQRLLHLINQLLDSAKLEAGSMSLHESRAEVALFVGQLIESFRLQAEKKGIQLTYDPQAKPAEYFFDGEKLEEIVYNLLANALKFTPSGGRVEVKLTLQPTQEEKTLLCLKVKDTGIGIAASQLPFIFDRFYQVEGSRTRAIAGSGLGLFLVKELTKLMGGHVEVESQEGKGATFTLTLPLREADNLGQAVLAPALPVVTLEEAVEEAVLRDLPESAADAPLVLVVEDHEELRAFIAGGLSGKYRIITAANGEEGWQLIQQELPNLVISDIAMPVMDGLTLSGLIKSTPLTAHIGLILLTARTSADNRVKGLSTGANDYLTKPFNLQELHLRVANLLTYQQTLQEYWLGQFGQPKPVALPAALAEPPLEDPFLLKVKAVLERELANSAFSVEQLAGEMAVSIRTLQRKLSALTGMNASELLRSFRLNKAAVLLREGHSVSQAAYQVGFESLSYFSKCFKAQFSLSPSEYAFLETSK